MTTNKKDVHRTGALASILSQSDIQAVDIKVNKKSESKSSSVLNADLIPPSPIPSREKPKGEMLVEISPAICKPWEFSDRDEAELGNIEELANSIEKAGQQEPILVRPIKNVHLSADPQIKYEIIFGNRRWRACKLIGKNLLAIVRELTDQEASLAQKEENENRQDISDYSKAMHYKRLIDAKIFENENQLALNLRIHRGRINDLMSYTRIPKQLLEAIPTVHLLSQRVAIKLASLSKNLENLEDLILLAPKIGSGKITSKNIDKELEELRIGKPTSTTKKSTPVVGKGGAEIFTIREDSNGAPCIVLHKATRQAINIDELKALLKNYIDKCIESNFSEEPA
ncbi:MAG: ParB/RepB/Spo0J family partition protein [Gammaproteobacteria bacterium]